MSSISNHAISFIIFIIALIVLITISQGATCVRSNNDYYHKHRSDYLFLMFMALICTCLLIASGCTLLFSLKKEADFSNATINTILCGLTLLFSIFVLSSASISLTCMETNTKDTANDDNTYNFTGLIIFIFSIITALSCLILWFSYLYGNAFTPFLI